MDLIPPESGRISQEFEPPTTQANNQVRIDLLSIWLNSDLMHVLFIVFHVYTMNFNEIFSCRYILQKYYFLFPDEIITSKKDLIFVLLAIALYVTTFR